jgi:hypothetical protein
VVKWRMRWAGHVACMGRGEAHRGFWWEPEGKRPRERGVYGRIILRCLQVVGCGRMDWIELAQDRERWRTAGTVNAVMNLGVP